MGTSTEASRRRSGGTDLPVHSLPRTASALWQVVTSVVVGAVVGALVVLFTPVQPAYAFLLGWDVAVVVYVIWVWVTSWRLDPEGTAAAAAREDPTRAVMDLILIVAAVASLAAVILTIADASNASGSSKLLLVALGIASIVCSWFLVHTLFTTRYAREYFADKDGGITFNMQRKPVWSDFAYLSFTIGMTFQVSDTAISDREIRATALRHGLLSFVFATGIIATTINLVASLTSR